MKKLFTLFMLLGLFSAPTFGQDADYGQQDSSATPIAATFCKEDAVAKDVASSGSGNEAKTNGSLVNQEESED